MADIILNDFNNAQPPGKSFLGSSPKREIKKAYLSPERIAVMKETYNGVIVCDYDDEYHMTDDDRRKKIQYYDAFKALGKCRNKIRKLDEYIRACRIYMICLKQVATTNGIYEPNEFINLVLKGTINVVGLKLPKYKGRDKKEISWAYVMNYITDLRLDPKELLVDYSEEIKTQDELKELEQVIFSKEELQTIFSDPSERELELENEFYDESLDYEGYNVIPVLQPKDTKKLLKEYPELVIHLRDMRRKEKALNNVEHSYIYQLDEDDFRTLGELDRKAGIKTIGEMPEFHGDIMDDDNYNLYLHAVKEYEECCVKVFHNGRYRTQEEIDFENLKNTLDASGWNLRTFYDVKNEKKKAKKEEKYDRKKEKEIKNMLLEIQKRKDKREGKDIDDGSKINKKQQKKKKKKPKSKSGKQLERDFDDIILNDVTNRREDDWKSYKSKMENCNWEDD